MNIEGTNIRPASAIPSGEEMIARAQAMLPRLRERARETEIKRRLSDETVAEMLDAELHKIMQPIRFGGFGMGMDTAAEVIRTLASACGSTGWISNLFISHNYQIGLFPIEAQEEYWAGGDRVVASTISAAPRSDMQAVDGGFRVSGHWKFSSGCDFASWFILMKPSKTCADWMLIPRKDVRIEDDWFVSGLCGTGSKDIILDDVFVPAHRTLSIVEVMSGNAPGGKAHGTPTARFPFPWTAIWAITSALLGMAEGMAEAVRQGLVNKQGIFSGEQQAERVANQIGLTQALTDIDAAKALMRDRIAQLHRWAQAGQISAPTDAWVCHRDATYVTRTAHRSAASLSLMAGASSIYLANPVQRFHRDINAGAAHFSQNWEEAAENYGRALWNLPPKMPM